MLLRDRLVRLTMNLKEYALASFLATFILTPSITLADSSAKWIQEKEQLLSNYRSLSNLKTSSLSPRMLKPL
jgi:hypothetical protein